MTKLTELVREAMSNAKDNGYAFEGASDEDVALDMMAYDAGIEHSEAHLSEVTSAVKIVRAERGVPSVDELAR